MFFFPTVLLKREHGLIAVFADMYSLLSRNEPIYFPVGDSFQHMGNSRVSMSVSNMDKTFSLHLP